MEPLQHVLGVLASQGRMRALPASGHNVEQYEYLSLSHVLAKSASEGKDTVMMGVFLFGDT